MRERSRKYERDVVILEIRSLLDSMRAGDEGAGGAPEGSSDPFRDDSVSSTVEGRDDTCCPGKRLPEVGHAPTNLFSVAIPATGTVLVGVGEFGQVENNGGAYTMEMH